MNPIAGVLMCGYYPFTYNLQHNSYKIGFLRTISMAELGYRVVKESVQPDSRGRVTLGTVAQSKNYRVMVNEAGQILLDPVVSIPERELWLWQNPEAIAAVQQGIAQASVGEVQELGAFAEYAGLELED